MSAPCTIRWTTIGATPGAWRSSQPPMTDLAGQIAELHTQCGLTAWSKKTWQSFLDSNRCVILLYLSEDNAQILAACLYQYVADEAELLQIFAHASSRGQGIGRQLLEASIDLLIIKDILYIYLEVSEQNTPAIGLYSSFGFQEIGVRGGYYRHQDGSAADALQMRFELQPTLA